MGYSITPIPSVQSIPKVQNLWFTKITMLKRNAPSSAGVGFSQYKRTKTGTGKSEEEKKVLALATRAAKTVVYKKTEVKAYDDYFTGSGALNGFNNVGTIFPLFSSLSTGGGISQGTGHEERLGIQIYMKNIHLQGTIKLYGATTNALVRLVVFRYKSDDSRTLTNVGDIFEGNGVYSRKKWDERFNSKILYDELIYVNSVCKPWHTVDVMIPVYHRVNYKISNNSYQDGGLYAILIGDNAATNQSCDYSFVYNGTFTDA